MARISVIVPAYNVEEYLADCLDSVLDQRVDDLEGWTYCSRCWSSPRCASAAWTSWPAVPARR
jgi:Glycosyl transferase family 2